MVVGFIGDQVIALALAVIVNPANATTVVGGIAVAVLVWIGFEVTLEIGELIWEKIPFKLFLIGPAVIWWPQPGRRHSGRLALGALT